MQKLQNKINEKQELSELICQMKEKIKESKNYITKVHSTQQVMESTSTKCIVINQVRA